MAKKARTFYLRVVRLAHIHFFYIAAFAASVIVFHASNLVPPDSILERWKWVAFMLSITTVVWYFARQKSDNLTLQKGLVFTLVLMDIGLASFLVYADRGMASLAVALYAVPILTSSALASRSAILATASLSTAAYALVAVKYFVDFFNEGYKAQLYSTVGFYGATFFILAFLLMAVIRTDRNG
jgi:hypothetical protein